MKLELQQKLRDISPDFYRDLAYFEVDDGWYEMLDEFSHNINRKLSELTSSESLPCKGCDGIYPKDEHPARELTNDDWEDTYMKEFCKEYLPEIPRVSQLKSKFATLVIYLDKNCQSIEVLVKEVEHKSTTVCEDCGLHGKLLRYGGWHLTLCDPCEKKQKSYTAHT